MSSILVFILLMGGFFWYKRSGLKPSSAPTQDVEGVVRNVFPDGTLEQIDESGEVLYVFDENNSLRVSPEGETFRLINGVSHSVPLPPSPAICGPHKETLNTLGLATNLTQPKMFHLNSERTSQLRDAWSASDKEGSENVDAILHSMQEASEYVEVERLFEYFAAQGNLEALQSLRQKFEYTPSPFVWERVALIGLETRPPALDAPPPLLTMVLEQPDKTWISNAFIHEVLTRRRYDLLEAVFGFGTDFRTANERMCWYAFKGDEVTLLFMDHSGSNVRAMAFYLAARQNHTGLAKSLLRSFTKEQQLGLKKMFTRLTVNPKQVLRYFA